MKPALLKLTLTLTASFALLGLTGSAMAGPGRGGHAHPGQPHTPAVHAREHREEARIAQGERSGELTQGEAQKLGAEQKSIRSEEKAARADGVVTPEERQGLHQDLNQASRDIYQAKHNDEKGVPMPPPIPPPPGAPPGWRQHEQKHRIAQGVRSGQLTKEEAQSLRQGEKNVRSEVKGFRSDGQFTPEERQKVRTDLNDLNKQIYTEKHDAETAPKK